MTHSDKDIEAANEYYTNIVNPLDNEVAFLSGCEHKQKEVDDKQQQIDELVDVLTTLVARCEENELGNWFSVKCGKQLIQKHKR